jgi:hypothetical protein
MANFVGMPQSVVGLTARQRGVKILSLTDSKVSGVWALVKTPYFEEGPLIDRLRELQGGAKSDSRIRAAEYIARFRQKFIQPIYHSKQKPLGISGWIKNEIHPYLAALRFAMGRGRENYVKSFGITVDYRPPRIILRDHYVAKRNRRAALSRSYDDLEATEKFAYLPLQVQPEAVIDMLAAHFSNQIETARQIALALPGDYTLVVKEHPSMLSRRSPSFHEKLARLPNVRLIHPHVPTVDVLKRCGLVIGPGGTTLAEAAFYRKPAIQLGRHGLTEMLPNIIRHTDMTTLSGVILDALNKNLDTGDYERRLENYIAAVYDTGLDINLGDVWYKGGKQEHYDFIYKKFRDEFVRQRDASVG